MAYNRDKNAFGYIGDYVESQGLTKREYTSILIMQGLISNTDSDKYILGDGERTTNAKNKALFCIALADELLNQLEK